MSENSGRRPEEIDALFLRSATGIGAANDSIRYEVSLFEGAIPARAGHCSLFIDTFGRPLYPVSLAGVRRREGRRR